MSCMTTSRMSRSEPQKRQSTMISCQAIGGQRRFTVLLVLWMFICCGLVGMGEGRGVVSVKWEHRVGSGCILGVQASDQQMLNPTPNPKRNCS